MIVKKLKTSTANFITVLYFRIYNTSFRKKFLHKSRIKIFIKKIYYLFIGNGLENVHTVFIETLSACNLRCSYCPNSVYERGLVKNNQFMETKTFYKIIDELAEMNWVGAIEPHSYGEPLLDKRLDKLCMYVHNKLPKSIIAIFTNGELLNIQWYKRLINAGVTSFKVAQHLEKQSVGVLEVINYRNKYGNDGVNFDYKKLEIIKSRGGLIELDSNATAKQECNWPDFHIGFSFDGEVMMCCNDYLNEVKIGNIKSERLIDIWNKLHYQKIRSDIREGNFTLDICKNCSDAYVTTSDKYD